MSRRPDPWEKQPSESDPAFAAFVAYRDLGLLRSTAKAAKAIGKSKRLIDGWSSKNSWRIRVSAWDAEVDRIDRLELLDQRRQMRERHVTLAIDLQEKVIAVLDQLGDNEDLAVKYFADPNALIRVVDVATKLERAALGEPDQHQVTIKNNSKGDDPDEVDFDALSDEEIQARMVELQRELASALGDYDTAHHDDDPDGEEE